MAASFITSMSAWCHSGAAAASAGALSAWVIRLSTALLLKQPTLAVLITQLVWNSGCRMLRPSLPYQSGYQLGWPRSHSFGLLFTGASPRSAKNEEPFSGRECSVMPQAARLAWIDSNTLVDCVSLEYRSVSVRPCGYPALASMDLHLPGSPLLPGVGYRL